MCGQEEEAARKRQAETVHLQSSCCLSDEVWHLQEEEAVAKRKEASLCSP